MAGAEIANLKAKWYQGTLIICDKSDNAIITVYPSSGGVAFGNGGGIAVSTGILGGLTVSGGATINGDVVISSGRYYMTGQVADNITTDVTLTATSCGYTMLVTVSDCIITLPGAGSSGHPLAYTIINTLTTAGQAVIKTTTSEMVVGMGSTAGVDIVANTAATHVDGDFVTVFTPGSSTSWAILGMAGTWASTT